MSRYTQMKTFVQVAKAQSFVAAAKSLRLSTAAVSKQISLLEQELSVQLLYRNTRSVSLTESGTQFLKHSIVIIQEMETAEANLSQIKEPSGRIKIVVGSYFGYQFLLPHLKIFFETYPKITLDVEFNERVPSLDDEDIDIIVGMSVSASDDTIQRSIGTTRYVLVASPEYIQKHGLPKKPQDLLEHKYITHSIRKPDNVIRFKNGEMLEVDPWLRFNNSQPLRQAILDGLGLGLLLEYVVREDLEAGTLCEIMKPYFPDRQPIYVSYKHNRFLPEKIRCFIDFFIQKTNI